jgi:flagellar motor switch protein FliN/FliY
MQVMSVESIAEGLIQAFKEVVQAASGKEIDAKLTRVEKKTKEDLQRMLEARPIGFEVAFESGLTGKLTFLFNDRDGLTFFDLASGTANTKTQLFDEATITALREILDQAVAQASAKLRQNRGTDIAAAPALWIEPKELPRIATNYFANAGALALAEFRLLIDASIDMQVQILFSTTLVQSAAEASVPSRPEVRKQNDEYLLDMGINLEIPESQRPSATMEARGSASGPSGTPEENLKDFEKNIQRILDIELPVSISFGQTRMLLKEVLQFSAGSIIQLDKTADDPVCLVVNNKVIAKGQVIVVDGNYGIRITEIESTTERIRSLG